jgi:hypothetical protein
MNGMETGKAFPGRPSVDSMTAGPYMSRNREFAQGATQSQAQTPVQGPSRRALLEGYKPSISNNFEDERPRFNPVSSLENLSSHCSHCSTEANGGR